MTDAPQARIALGYLRKYPGAEASSTAQLRQRLEQCAEANGYHLLDVHIEELDTEPAAFFSLVAAIATTGAEAVVVPTKTHLGSERVQDSKLVHLRRTTNADVLILGQVS